MLLWQIKTESIVLPWNNASERICDWNEFWFLVIFFSWAKGPKMESCDNTALFSERNWYVHSAVEQTWWAFGYTVEAESGLLQSPLLCVGQHDCTAASAHPWHAGGIDWQWESPIQGCETVEWDIRVAHDPMFKTCGRTAVYNHFTGIGQSICVLNIAFLIATKATILAKISWNNNRYFILETTFVTFVVTVGNCWFPSSLTPPPPGTMLICLYDILI